MAEGDRQTVGSAGIRLCRLDSLCCFNRSVLAIYFLSGFAGMFADARGTYVDAYDPEMPLSLVLSWASR